MQAEFGISREMQNELYCNEYKSNKKASFLFHFHSQIELNIVEEGEIEAWVNDKRKILKKDEMSVSLSYDAHCNQSLGESKGFLLIIPTHLCEEFVNAVKNKRVSNPFIQNHEAVRKMRECFYEIKNAGGNHIKRLGYIYVVLGILMEEMQFEPLPEPIDRDLSSRILFYINENYKNDLSLPSIASALGYNPTYLSRYFRSCFRIGINNYITLVRLRWAITLIQEGKYNITSCALESGFNSTRSFYRAFTKEFGCTPKEYLFQKSAKNSSSL